MTGLPLRFLKGGGATGYECTIPVPTWSSESGGCARSAGRYGLSLTHRWSADRVMPATAQSSA